MKYQTKADSLLKSMFQRLAPIAAMVCCTLFLFSCNRDKSRAIDNVKKLFTKSKIYQLDSSTFIFYVVDSSGVKKVTCLNLSDNNIDGIESLVELK